jgi:hypothetical protein
VSGRVVEIGAGGGGDCVVGGQHRFYVNPKGRIGQQLNGVTDRRMFILFR